jgi:hypothetical protein
MPYEVQYLVLGMLVQVEDPGHELQITCGRIQMLATEIFREEPPPPRVNMNSVASILPGTVVLWTALQVLQC